MHRPIVPVILRRLVDHVSLTREQLVRSDRALHRWRLSDALDTLEEAGVVVKTRSDRYVLAPDILR